METTDISKMKSILNKIKEFFSSKEELDSTATVFGIVPIVGIFTAAFNCINSTPALIEKIIFVSLIVILIVLSLLLKDLILMSLIVLSETFLALSVKSVFSARMLIKPNNWEISPTF